MVTRRSATAFLLVALAASVLAVPQQARAAHDVRFGIKDDAWLLDGPGTISSRLDRLQAIGVQVVRFGLRWDEIAPTRPADAADPNDPAYRWSAFDAVLRGLHERGIEALVGIWGTPRWANRGRTPNWIPRRASAVAGFATAAARRYPWVHRWLVWNEPNQRIWLRPTSPKLYVERLLDPAYRSIHRVIHGAQVGGGVTAPRGGPGGVSPVAWIRGMAKAHARLDAYAHNPYPLDPRRETPTHGVCGSYCATITMASLPRLLRDVRRAFGPRARIWLTEYGYQTRPPDPLLGVSPARQALYLEEAALRAYRAPRVDLLIHFLYRDEPQLGGFQSGLTFVDNRPKPALRAFELPLAEIGRHGARVRLWGQLRLPEAARYRLEVYRGHGRWRSLTPWRRTHGRGYVTWKGALSHGARVRLATAGVHSPALRIR